ncbi:MAG: cbb3-type cytochrome oxidase assembly protein CcoS [Burkholderiales bacterium]|jgi:cbb3-type cytochrome oxidase maturation protein|nr:cbb3-type cytochrome oxidase assembly protein CcoS [Burkholderiales bacterium]
MEILWIMIPVSLFIVLVMGGIFWWSVKSGQFDDLDGPAYRILVDDDTPREKTTLPGGLEDEDNPPNKSDLGRQ